MQLNKLPFLALLVTFAFQAQAINFIATNEYIVAEDQVVAEEQWVIATHIEAGGTFKNDLFITSANELKLNGTFEGNVWGAASEGSHLKGQCSRNVRLTGKMVRIDGAVIGNVMAMAETVIIGKNAVISGNVRLIASSIIQEGIIRGNVTITAARVVTLGGTIEGNVKLAAPDILFSRDASIKGDLAYTANKELFPAEGIVEGKLAREIPEAEPLFSVNRLTTRAMWFFAAFLAGVPFITLFPMTTAMASQFVRKSPWKCLAIGFLASGALPMFGIMSLSSIVSIPLGSLILASWGIMLYLSRIVMGLVIGSLLLRSLGTSIGRVLLAMLLGLAVIYLATIIPSIGMPVQLTVIWLGMGSLILSLIEKRRLIIQVPQNLKKLEELRNEQYNPEEK
ncbi:MAG: polymer-forming cytoskeletal protein [Pontiella sp.]